MQRFSTAAGTHTSATELDHTSAGPLIMDSAMFSIEARDILVFPEGDTCPFSESESG